MGKLDTNPPLVTHLDNNNGFTYAHLVKFERPFSIKGKLLENSNLLYSTKYTKYSYITDAGFDISWDDGSTYYSAGSQASNGVQVYRANKLLKVGNINETDEVKIANFNITLDASALDAYIPPQGITFTSDSITSSTSFIEVGFREGDKIVLFDESASSISEAAPNHAKSFRIESFKNEGNTITVSSLDGPINTTPGVYSIYQNSTEITSITAYKNSVNFVNREVSIYKVFFYTEEGQTSTKIGEPVLLFKGIVTTAQYKEDPSKGATIDWTVRNQWADFQQVTGRFTSDEFHRALDPEGNANSRATIRPEYASDWGFQHGNKAIDLIGLYTTMETRYKKKTKTSWGTKKVKFKAYEVPVDNEVDLKFNISARYLPVIYGVRRTPGIPVFVDTSATNPGRVFLADAICEGPIQSIMNIYIEDESLICIDEADADVRQNNPGTVDTECFGRLDRGDVLKGSSAITAANTSLVGSDYSNQDGGGNVAKNVSLEQYSSYYE